MTLWNNVTFLSLWTPTVHNISSLFCTKILIPLLERSSVLSVLSKYYTVSDLKANGKGMGDSKNAHKQQWFQECPHAGSWGISTNYTCRLLNDSKKVHGQRTKWLQKSTHAFSWVIPRKYTCFHLSDSKKVHLQATEWFKGSCLDQVMQNMFVSDWLIPRMHPSNMTDQECAPVSTWTNPSKCSND